MLWINLSHVHWHWRDDDLKEVPEIGMEYFISYTQKRKRQQKSFKGLESCVSLDPCLTNVEKIGVRRCDYNRGLSCKGFTVLCFVSCVLCRASCVLCYVSCVVCHVSCVLCCVSCVRCPYGSMYVGEIEARRCDHNRRLTCRGLFDHQPGCQSHPLSPL